MKNKFTRREFLKTGALSSLALGGGVLSGKTKNITKKSAIGDAKNVIFMVTDGMSSG